MSFLDNARERREAVTVEKDAILAAVATENRSDLTAEETTKFDSLVEESRSLDAKIEKFAAEAAADAKASEARASVASIVTPRVVTSVVSEPTTYAKEARTSYFRDLVGMKGGDSDATERLMRHKAETRAISTTDTAMGEFVPPLWLVSDYAEFARAASVGKNLVSNLDLPAGTDSISIPTITTGSLTAIQAGNNAAVTTRDQVTSSVTAPVRTFAGYSDASQQLLDQSAIGSQIDKIIFGDLMSDLALQLNSKVVGLNDGTSNTVYGLTAFGVTNAVTWTETTPSALNMLANINKAISTVATTRFLPAEAILMTPAHWYWLNSQVDSSGRPLILPGVSGPSNAAGINGAPAASAGLVGTIGGVPVYIDATMSKVYATNQAPILVGKFTDSYLFTSGVTTKVFEDVLSSTMGVRFRAHQYAALAHRQAKSVVAITGTGSVAPTGY
jgi:HK97 family phage major capsid protein